MTIVAGVSPVFMMLWFLLSANGLWLTNLIGTRWDAQTGGYTLGFRAEIV